MLVIDSSKSMEEDALIERVREAAHAFVDAKAATDQIAIVTLRRRRHARRGLHHRRRRLSTRRSTRSRSETGTSLWDGDRPRRSPLRATPRSSRTSIVFSDGEDADSSATADQAEAAVTSVGGTLFAVGVENPGFDRARRGRRGHRRRGRRSPTIPSGVGALFEDVQATLRKQYVTTFASESAETGPIPIDLAVGSDTATAEYISGQQPGGRGVAAARRRSRSRSGPELPAVARGPRHRARPRGARGRRRSRSASAARSSATTAASGRPCAPTPTATSRDAARRRRRRRRQGPAAGPDAAPPTGRRGHGHLRRAARVPHQGRGACSSGPTSRCARPRRCSSTSRASRSSRCCSSPWPTAPSPPSSASSSSP